MLLVELQFNSNKQTNNQTVSHAPCFPNNEYSTQHQPQSAGLSAQIIISVRSLRSGYVSSLQVCLMR